MAKRAKKKRPFPGAPSPSSASVRPTAPCLATSPRPWLSWLQAILIMVVTVWIYWPALHGGFLSDDGLYFKGNLLLQQPDRLWKAWFEPGSFIEYYPITQSLQWIQWQLWGEHTLGYHLTNVVLHIISALLVWKLLARFNLRWAWLGGLLFAIHPMAVEAIAWMAEFKSALSLPPFLLAMISWVDYENHKRSRDYYLALGWFLVAMLCKITMTPFPIVILVYAWWKRGRLGWRDIKTSIPFFIISLVLGRLTMLCGDWFALTNPRIADPILLGDIVSRIACIGTTLAFYLAHCFLPVGMSPVYPLWTVDPPSALTFIPWLIFGGIFYWSWQERRTWGRHVIFALLFFFLFLAPFAGIIPVSFMAYTWVMDHFVYIAWISWIGLVVAACEWANRRMSAPAQRGFLVAIAAVLVLLAWGSHVYAGAFAGEKALWSYAVQQNPGSASSHNNLGGAFFDEGNLPEAIKEYGQAIKIQPDYAAAHADLGNALLDTGHIPEAMESFNQALKINPNFAEAHYNLGLCLLRLGQAQGAVDQFMQAIRFNPSYVDAYLNLGNVLQEAGQNNEAITQYEQALRLSPNFAAAHNGLGNALLNQNQLDEAIVQFQQALRLNPEYPEALNGLGNALQNQGHLDEAIAQYERALQINPNMATVHNGLGCALLTQGRKAKALAHFEEALRIQPNYTIVRANLTRLQASQKKTPLKK